MNPISELRQEHIAIERELFELESIMEDDVINYSNLVHTFRKLCDIWDPHERREEDVFMIMKRENFVMPTTIMTSEHKDISGHIKALRDAINSGSDFEVKICFDRDLRVIVDKLRNHMIQEDEVLYTIALDEFSEDELAEMARVLEEGKDDIQV